MRTKQVYLNAIEDIDKVIEESGLYDEDYEHMHKQLNLLRQLIDKVYDKNQKDKGYNSFNGSGSILQRNSPTLPSTHQHCPQMGKTAQRRQVDRRDTTTRQKEIKVITPKKLDKRN